MVDLSLLHGAFEYIEGTNPSLDTLKVTWRETLVSCESKPANMNLLKLRSFKNQLLIFKQEFDDEGKPFDLKIGSTSSIKGLRKVEYTSTDGFYFKEALEVKTSHSTYYFYIN